MCCSDSCSMAYHSLSLKTVHLRRSQAVAMEQMEHLSPSRRWIPHVNLQVSHSQVGYVFSSNNSGLVVPAALEHPQPAPARRHKTALMYCIAELQLATWRRHLARRLALTRGQMVGLLPDRRRCQSGPAAEATCVIHRLVKF